jgi:methyl-accepting chemotaxis protein
MQNKSVNEEIKFDDDMIVVIKTNLQGIILEANDDFYKLTGLLSHEVIGQKYVSFIHKDVPNEFVDDMWLSLGAMRPWTGVIKNRTPNYFYWSNLNAIPEFKNNSELASFLLVSLRLEKGQLDKTLSLYSDINNRLVTFKKSRFKRFFDQFKNTSPQTKLIFSSTAVILPLLTAAYFSDNVATSITIAFSGLVSTGSLFLNHKSNLVLDKSVTTFYTLAAKKFNTRFDLRKEGLIGDFHRALFSMSVALQLDIAKSKKNETENVRINNALDGVHSAVLVADVDLNVIFANQSALQLFQESEADIKKQLPEFDAKKILGSNIDQFHVKPEKQRKMLHKLTGYYASQLTIGGHIMNVVANPIFDKKGEKIGYVAEWMDRTKEIQAVQDIANIIDAASKGNFENKISEQNQTGFLLELTQNLNRLFDITANSLKEIDYVLEALSQGDLTSTIHSDYSGLFQQIKTNVNSTVERLRYVIHQIQDTTEVINNSATEIASGNNDLSKRTETQAASLEETAASMEELTATVNHNANNAKQANQLALAATMTAERGVDVVKKVVSTMTDINDASRKISDIISVIDDIAFQTNILALNAAVEAARAGEQGKGFAVVAVEVRNLAQRSAKAAGEIKDLINDSVSKVTDGTQLVENAGQTMGEIVNSVKGVTQMMSEITSASMEQSHGIEEVNKAIRQIDEVTQQNAALVEQSAAAAESLEDQARNLAGSVSHFKAGNVSQKLSPSHSDSKAKVKQATPPKKVTHQLSEHDWEEF